MSLPEPIARDDRWCRRAEVFAAPLPGFPGRLRRAALRSVVAALGPLVEIEGRERLVETAAGEPVLFALNHGNSLEALLVPAVLIYLRGGRPVHFLADWMFLELPLVGPVLRMSEPIPVYGKPARWRWREGRRRERAKRPVLDACLDRLAAGGSLGLFPEGRRNPSPDRLLRGRPGLGELVLGSRAPVVPIGISYPAAGRLGRAPRFGRLRLRVGESLGFEAERALAAALPAGGLGRLRTRRALARRIVERTMAALGELSGKRPFPGNRESPAPSIHPRGASLALEPLGEPS